jgi:DDE family transposase
MPYPEELDYWTAEISTGFGQLSKTQAAVLALYSYGMVMTQHCGQTIIVTFLGMLTGIPIQNLRQRLREWNYESEQKRGEKRQAIQVETHFGSLLGVVLSGWRKPRRLLVALDVTYLRDRHTILTVSVLYRGCAIPVAWRVLNSNQKGEWHPIWVNLLERLSPAVAGGCQVLVLCDRGLYSKRLFAVIRNLGWHPFMRIRPQGLYRHLRSQKWQSLASLAFRGMKSRCLRIECFKGDPLLCSLWIHWQAQYDEPCLIVTDLAPTYVRGNPYALRIWIEAGFKDLKRGGLGWEQSKTTLPQRMERLMLVMALALFWLVRQGSVQADDFLFDPIPASLSCVTLGWLSTLVGAIQHRSLPVAYFSPYFLPPIPS